MGNNNDPQQVSFLQGNQQAIFDQIAQIIQNTLGNFNPPDLQIAGPSDLQQQGFQQASQFAQNPFGEGGQAALQQLLSGEAAFQLSPELTAQRNELFQQSFAPARDAFGQELRGIQDQFGALGLSRSGGIQDASARAAERFGTNLGAQRAGILQGDINASIASQEQARRNQAFGLQLGLGGGQAGLAALFGAGQTQRGIQQQQFGADFFNQLQRLPIFNPAIGLGLGLTQARNFGFQQQAPSTGQQFGNAFFSGLGGGLGGGF